MINLLSIFTRFNTKTLLLTLVCLLLLILAWFLVIRVKSSWRKVMIALLIFLTCRFMFFGNPFIWTIYYKLTNHKTIDQRLGMLTLYKMKENFSFPISVHYAAIGTSQVNALFREYVENHPFVNNNSMAGMLPNEYFLCRSFINNSPDTLILYLSEFDFCREPNYTSLYVLPEQYFGWFSKAKILQKNYPGKKFECNAFKLMMNDFFPEFKYRLVLRHIILNLLHLDSTKMEPSDSGLKSHLEGLKLLTDDGFIKYHIGTFQYFISEASRKGKTVIICQGSYNPLALSAKNEMLRKEVRNQLESLVKRYPKIIYIPLEDQYPLPIAEFFDGYHVNAETGYRWADYLFQTVIPSLQTK